MTATVQQSHEAYVAAHEAAQAAARRLVGTRVEWYPFGRPSSTRAYVGTVTRVDLGGVLVRWDDAAAFWDGTKPSALNPRDLRVAK